MEAADGGGKGRDQGDLRGEVREVLPESGGETMSPERAVENIDIINQYKLFLVCRIFLGSKG